MKYTYACKKVSLNDSIKAYTEKKIAAVVLAAAEDEEAVVQQVHLQDGLFRAHGLYGEALGADHGEFLLLRHVEVGCGRKAPPR